MIEIIIYEATDGKQFSNKEDCLAYERTLLVEEVVEWIHERLSRFLPDGVPIVFFDSGFTKISDPFFFNSEEVETELLIPSANELIDYWEFYGRSNNNVIDYLEKEIIECNATEENQCDHIFANIIRVFRQVG